MEPNQPYKRRRLLRNAMEDSTDALLLEYENEPEHELLCNIINTCLAMIHKMEMRTPDKFSPPKESVPPASDSGEGEEA